MVFRNHDNKEKLCEKAGIQGDRASARINMHNMCIFC